MRAFTPHHTFHPCPPVGEKQISQTHRHCFILPPPPMLMSEHGDDYGIVQTDYSPSRLKAEILLAGLSRVQINNSPSVPNTPGSRLRISTVFHAALNIFCNFCLRNLSLMCSRTGVYGTLREQWARKAFGSTFDSRPHFCADHGPRLRSSSSVR